MYCVQHVNVSSTKVCTLNHTFVVAGISSFHALKEYIFTFFPVSVIHIHILCGVLVNGWRIVVHTFAFRYRLIIGM